MKLNLHTLAAAPLLLAAAATAQTTGTSHPETLDDNITTTQPAAAEHYHKPSAGTPIVSVDPKVTPLQQSAATPPPSPALVRTEPAQTGPLLHHKTDTVDPDDINSGVITSIAVRPNELPEGTLLHVKLDQSLTTETSRVGDHFTGRLTRNIERDGKILVPAGSIVRGRISEVRTSKRFTQDALLRLQPDTLTLPDGIPYPVSAQLIDFDHTQDAHVDTRINSEGEVVTDTHTRRKVAGMTLTAAGAGAAGAMIGGGVGFVLGAAVGAGANAIMWSKQDHEQTLAAGTVLILNLDQPLMLNPPPVATFATTGTE